MICRRFLSIFVVSAGTSAVWPSPAADAATWPPASDTLPAPVASALQAAGVPPEAVSMVVLPVEPGPARLEHDAHAVRQMASVMKLFTTGAALTTLGPAYVWRTDVALGGPLRPSGTLDGPLYLRGSGDPGLVLEYVQLMMSRWRAAGLKTIHGDLVLDRTAFDTPPHAPGDFDNQPLKPYNAGPDALLLNHQAVTLRFAPDAARAGQVRVSMEPQLDGVRLDARVRLLPSSACGEWREALTLRTEPAAPPVSSAQSIRQDLPNASRRQLLATQRWALSVQGSYSSACGAREWPILWQGDGPGDHAARVLAATWKQLGGRLDGHIATGIWPDDAVVWQSWTSPPLAQIVRDINKFSNNVMARQLFLAMAPRPGPATLEGARAAITQQIQAATKDETGLTPCTGEALVLDNGSGLSRTEHGSARCLARWLQAMWASPAMPEFVASLPISGMDGTARRMGSVAGKAHLKTGSLDGVAAVAGYVDGESGRRYVVVGVINHPLADAARPALEALAAWAMRDQSDQK